MIPLEEESAFLEQCHLHVPGVLTSEHQGQVQGEFDRVWDLPGQSNRTKLLQHKTFLALIEPLTIPDRPWNASHTLLTPAGGSPIVVDGATVTVSVATDGPRRVYALDESGERRKSVQSK